MRYMWCRVIDIGLELEFGAGGYGLRYYGSVSMQGALQGINLQQASMMQDLLSEFESLSKSSNPMCSV